MKHTPGPWHTWPVHIKGYNNSVGPVSSYQIRDQQQRIIAKTSMYGEDSNYHELYLQKDANAHLIAAAPELLELAEAVLSIGNLQRGGIAHGIDPTEFAATIAPMARAAIRKATGKEETQP